MRARKTTPATDRRTDETTGTTDVVGGGEGGEDDGGLGKGVAKPDSGCGGVDGDGADGDGVGPRAPTGPGGDGVGPRAPTGLRTPTGPRTTVAKPGPPPESERGAPPACAPAPPIAKRQRGRPPGPRVESPFRGGDPGAPILDGRTVSSRDPHYLTADEREARRVVVRQLLALGVTIDQLPAAMGQQGWPMSRAMARSEYDAVVAEWVADHAHYRDSSRATQVRRLEGDLARYRAQEAAEEGERGAKTRWQAIVQTEALLARIQGHAEPTRVEVRVEASVVVRDALAEAVASLTTDEVEALLAEERELEALAAEARRDARALVVRGDPVG